jgi:uncharacterized protein (DUF1810 family)
LENSDAYELDRFVEAQSPCIDRVIRELQQGYKQSHWMWFIFPQFIGLGTSSTAVRYAIRSAREARAYSIHPILGPRLVQCTELVLSVEGRTVEQIFGFPDDLKFRSSMTLFANAAIETQVFKDAIEKYFAGVPDQLTIDLLAT